MRRVVSVSLLACSLAAASLFAHSRVSAQDKEAGQNAMPDLVGALKNTPGVLGVDAAKTMSGKNVIFAWFENKKAVVDWYYSPTHTGLMKAFAGPGPYRKPLEQVKDDKTPILVIASLTIADKPKFKEITLRVSQIAIELYQPTPGGASLGGRFAPSTVKVDHLAELQP